jgi:hypothetical protein
VPWLSLCRSGVGIQRAAIDRRAERTAEAQPAMVARMNFMSLLFPTRSQVGPVEPDPFAEQDMTGFGLNIAYWVAALGENKAVPAIGDIVIRITSCSMGMTVRRDDRFRVIGPGRKNGSAIVVPCINVKTGETDELSIFYMREHLKIARTWVLTE